ncbi:hypothetical protein AOL_s00215g139 [Orbilia oligospora ATCC 24927]|uniref:Uncharacterized protein n=1 Tax=Arthrobotrys oligospora (strain ATCC 24927 / CBS 115.81 / DSM 1491) TaxID=756982 RepID=G1XTL0_ARTOA|nr:hypothetical protein AOL_s00215g139 [Orbilia oligospora ATCC 24927]EGX43403.1 hypothetical protein AOL_s00215g139 [Orbilia oligospora ATCC 24927]
MSNAGTARTPPTHIDLDLRREESVNTDTSSGVVIVNGERRHGKKKKNDTLSKKTSELWFRLFLAVCASAFIVLPFFAYSLDGKEVQQNEQGKIVLESIKWVSHLYILDIRIWL